MNMQGTGFMYTDKMIRVKSINNSFSNVGFYNENLFRLTMPQMADPIIPDTCTDYSQDGQFNPQFRGALYHRYSVDTLIQ